MANQTRAQNPASQDNTATERAPRILACIPCYNSGSTIVEVVQALLDHSTADLLLVDDLSDPPLKEVVPRAWATSRRVEILRPRHKVYSGGGKNMGIQHALRQHYDFAVLLDSDVVVQPDTLDLLISYLRDTAAITVSPAILPHGNSLQYADTLINFSKYLPQPRLEVSWKDYLAGYCFAVHLGRYRAAPCWMPDYIGGDDVVYFRRLRAQFGLERLPVLNQARVVHKPPRSSWHLASRAQARYGNAYFANVSASKHWIFGKIPPLQLLTPRFWLMVKRVIGSGRIYDLRLAPVCWWLDLIRAVHILQLQYAGFEHASTSKPPSRQLAS